MLSAFVRRRAQALLNAAALALNSLGLSPNAITMIGFASMCGIAVLLANGQFALGGILVIVAGIFDALDGTLARLTQRVTKFGAFFDSTTDRFAEGALFFGILIWYVEHGVIWISYVVYLTLLGSLMVSYARARAEGIGVECREGLLTRFERIVLLIVGLVLTSTFGDMPLFIVLVLLAVFTNLTAVQRMWLVYRSAK